MSRSSNRTVLVIGLGAFPYGKERRAVNFFQHCQSRKPYFLISKWENGGVSALLRDNGFRFEHASFGYLGRKHLYWTFLNVLHMPNLFFRVVRAFFREGAREICIFDVHALINAFPAILFLRLCCRARLSFYVGDIPAPTRTNRWVAGLVNRQRSQIVAISDAVRRGLIQIGVEAPRISVVHNGLDLDAYKKTKRSGLKERFNWPGDSIVVGYAGQISERKGICDFIDAASIVQSIEPCCRFVVYGSLDSNNPFHCSVKARVEHLGLSPTLSFAGYSTDMTSAYSEFDIQVMPSRHEEALGNVAIEAAAAGIPIVASRTGGISETVIHGVTGFLVEKERPDEIARHLCNLIRDPALRHELGRVARLRAESDFDIRKNAERIERVLFYDQVRQR